MYYPCSENKGADQLRGYREADLRLCFRIGKIPVFSRCGSIIIMWVVQEVMQTRIPQCNPLADSDAHGARPVCGSGAWLIGFITRITIHCYTQIINGLGLSEKKFLFYVFLILSLWELMTPGMGHLSPQGHDWQDLCIPNYNTAAYNTYKLWVFWFQRRRRFSHFKPMSDNHTPGCGLYEPQEHCWQDLQ